MTHDPAVGQHDDAVTVWNGGGSQCLATDVGAALRQDGLSVAAAGNAQQTGQEQTVVLRNTLMASTTADGVAHQLAQLLEAPVLARPEPDAHTPLVVLLCSDMAGTH
jgi:hypothetical protein